MFETNRQMIFEEMSPKHILNVFKQAMITFPSRKYPTKDVFTTNFDKLKALMDLLTKEHVNFDESLLQQTDKKSPCTYIQIYEDYNVNISIFVVRPGYKLPLHDHPHMHGLLKVIAGSFKIQAYTEDKTLVDKVTEASPSPETTRMRKLAAKKLDAVFCNEQSESCVLTPGDGNFHEIEPIDGPAAFLDILSPPYDALIEELGQRDCNYYKVEHEISPNIVQLTQIPQPAWFWCETANYLGPHLSYILNEIRL